MLMLCYECFLVEEHNELCILEIAIRQRREVERTDEERSGEKMSGEESSGVNERTQHGGRRHHEKFSVEVNGIQIS